MSIPEGFSSLPALIQPSVELAWEKMLSRAENEGLSSQLSSLNDETLDYLIHSFAGSDYVADQLERNCGYHLKAMRQTWYWQPFSELDYSKLLGDLSDDIGGVGNEAGLYLLLRVFRQVMMVRLIIRDQNRLASLVETTAELTQLAETTLDFAIQFYQDLFRPELGDPFSAEGKTKLELVVLGMGKLGAHELNLSSDIDLIFFYLEDGETQGGKKSLSNEQYFLRLGQKVINSLSKVTADGFVFRVDMRLRPYGQSGPLALNFTAAENYYEKQGRDWERYAMVKARVVAGDKKTGQRLLQSLQPFIYRRYIDFGAFSALREMKALINREVQRRGIERNIKTGPGGIREIEFIAQAFQLIRGGQDPQLRERSLLKVYQMLKTMELLPAGVVDELIKAYCLLRDLEHCIQGYQDKQTQLLPTDELVQERIAFAMQEDNWDGLMGKVTYYRHLVRNHFEEVIKEPDQQDQSSEDSDDQVWNQLWHQPNVMDLVAQPLQAEYWHEFLVAVSEFAQSRQVARLQDIGRERLDRLMPKLLRVVHGTYNQSAADKSLDGKILSQRLIPVLEAILRRSSYMAMLLENPQALEHMVKLSAASPWIAQQLASLPVLLDELTDAVSLYSPPGVDELRDELRQHLLRIPSDDLEWQMEHLRHFKNVHMLRVAAAEIQGSLHIMKVSDYLTFLAEVILEAVLQLAWQQMTEKHGRPMREDHGPCDPDFIIVAYGKMGGLELGYSSDLDLVFIHDSASNLSTDGEKPLDNANFFARLGQRIIHFLTAQTPSGRLYEVDMRLRPSGASGLLVSSMTAFAKYQGKNAWTWEHQALVRARWVAGCEQLKEKFEALRHSVLQQTRDPKALLQEVIEMREKMRSHLGKSRNEQEFDIKHDSGGMVDIEFMVQHAVLNWGHCHPELTTYTDNVRIIDALETCHLWSAEDCSQLKSAYLSYRSINHRLALQNTPTVMEPNEELSAYRANVSHQWQLRMLHEDE